MLQKNVFGGFKYMTFVVNFKQKKLFTSLEALSGTTNSHNYQQQDAMHIQAVYWCFVVRNLDNLYANNLTYL
jgi:hypothetical protein